MGVVLYSLLVAGGISVLWQCLSWVWRRKQLYAFASKLPGPYAVPLIGSAYLFICKTHDVFARIRAILRRHSGPVVGLWVGTKLLVVVRDADMVERVVQSTAMLRKAEIMDALKIVLGDGLIVGSGVMWRTHRRAFTPMLGARAVRLGARVARGHARALVGALRPCARRGGLVDVDRYLQRASLDAVAEAFIGMKINTLGDMGHGISEDIVGVYDSLYDMMLKPWLAWWQRLCAWAGVQTSLSKTSDELKNFIHIGIEQTRKKRLNSFSNGSQPESDQNDKNSNKEESNDYHTNGFMANGLREDVTTNRDLESDEEEDEQTILESLLDSDLEITDENLMYEFVNLFMASADTVAQICSFALRMFALHPYYQDLAHQEVVKVAAGRKPCRWTPEDCSQLVFLEQCIKETLRLFPIAPFMARSCGEDFSLNDKLTVPCGSNVILAMFAVYRDPQHWARPEEFHPDHFLPEFTAKRHPFAYLPFSYGLRSCIGKAYAMTSMKITLAELLLQYRFTCPPQRVTDLRLSTDISVREIGGCKVALHLRD